jgi:dolichyl-phosphate-mannose-protein mannosyltransferase
VARRVQQRVLLAIILGTHVAALLWSAGRHSPGMDEPRHLVAGIGHWQFGRFDLFSVNPPLVRMIASVPVLAARPEIDWRRSPGLPGGGGTFGIGKRFLALNGEDCVRLFCLARWACVPLSLVGACVCFCWGRELYGNTAGFVAAILWCVSPNIMASASMITPDVGAAALGAASVFCFWRWLRQPSWDRALVAGAVLGLAELTKTTWIVLFPLLPALWLIWKWPWRARTSAAPGLGQLVVILVVGLYLINVGYGFRGSCQRLGDFEFVSEALAGCNSGTAQHGNRFAGSFLGEIPVPLPEDYLLGIDTQRQDFERKRLSYLRGEWKHGGWWYYYLYALTIKVPLGALVLVVLALLLGLFGRGYAASWKDELMLLAPVIVVLVLISSQTGINHHLRYTLPVFPFAFVWISKVFQAFTYRHHAVSVAGTAALVLSAGSSLYCFPHSLSYFNEMVGGPMRGHTHLGCVREDSNIDWGQDLLYLRQWVNEHAEASPLYLSLNEVCDPAAMGIEYDGPPAGADMGPLPGWYAISVNRIRNHNHEYTYFLRFEPVATAGYSVYIYYITLDDANQIRRDMGLPELRLGTRGQLLDSGATLDA